jgi:hypothetical protein
MDQFTQFSLSDWSAELVYSAAVLRDNPQEFAIRHGVTFTRSADDLDAFDAACVTIGRDHRIALIRYVRSPLPGTTVMLDSDIPKACAAWAAFKQCFEIRDNDCLRIDASLRAN